MKLFSCNMVDQLWNLCGDFGRPEGKLRKEPDGSNFFQGTGYTIKARREEEEGVCLRKDIFVNTSEKNCSLYTVRSRFTLDGGEYEVYTQYNSWQNESIGSWCTLNSHIGVGCESIRTSRGSNPMAALWNLQTNRGIVFHLLADASWNITVMRLPGEGELSHIVIELGLNSSNLNIAVASGETFPLPEILYYEIRNKTDLDCWKLHRYFHQKYPKHELPVMYNSWLYKFDRYDFESIAKQIPIAADLGIEYFVIDAGWFGLSAKWYESIGDWEEGQAFGFGGRMKELADLVRQHSMKFGLWLEIERAVSGAQASEIYPQYYIKEGNNYFLNFADPKACEYMFITVSGLIKKYEIQFIKFDFNEDLIYDKLASAFIDYFKGYRSWIKRLKETFPELYLENCASGGMRMNLKNCVDFDSIWLTDNQSPYEGIRIFKDSILHLPPQSIDRWAAITTVCDAAKTYYSDYYTHILATGDAVWEHVTGIHMSYLKGFLSGGPLGISCDLEKLSGEVRMELKEHIRLFKQERNFWREAECRILSDTNSVLVLQFSDRCLKKIIIQIFTKRIMQAGLRIYPVLAFKKVYKMADGVRMQAEELERDGIYILLDGNYKMQSVMLSLDEEKCKALSI